ncbi:MAG TPA: ZIP family metal transporter [Candidatus Limnocylindria bacterium]|nr:ZIP family metal transporter [Candidatus Limnocylindria bacterium]
MANYWQVLFFSLVGGVFSLVGGMLLLSRKKTAEALARYSTPFAAGALLAAAFFDLLPESLHELDAEIAARWILGGMVLFFLLEHFLHWFHHHHEHDGKHSQVSSPAPLIIAGDSIHNLLDGVAIGAAFLIDVPTGIVAAIAVAAHEIPQEIGDFGLLLKFGYARRRVILINVLSALTSTIGALVTFWLGSESELPVGALLAVTAGMFIYIASSDLIPTIHEESKRKVGHLAAALLIAGIVVIGITTTVAHQYIDTGHAEEEASAHVEGAHYDTGMEDHPGHDEAYDGHSQ